MDKKVFKFNGDMFIIPNPSGRLSEYFLESYRNRLREMCTLNGVTEEDPEMIQIWIVIPDYTDNLDSHGIGIDGEAYRCECSVVPLSMVKAMREGESKTFIFNGGDLLMKNECLFELTLTAAQSKYRYARFGNWERCIEKYL